MIYGMLVLGTVFWAQKSGVVLIPWGTMLSDMGGGGGSGYHYHK
jgi:hypothetical protein